MPDSIPEGLTYEDVAGAIADFDQGVPHGFAPSTRYDLVFNSKAYPPKAIVGLAARRLVGRPLTPEDFKGGEGSRCFRILRDLGFEIAAKEEIAKGPTLFVVGEKYTRHDIYEMLNVPQDKRRGNWETGYTRWGNDLFMFPTVGSAATGGFDYNNGWEGDVFRWYAKDGTRLDQPLIQWILTEAERVFVFTRPAVRNPFTFEGLGTPLSWEDESPVLIRWRIDRKAGVRSLDRCTFPDEVTEPTTFVEGATHQVSVNAYERNPKARQACLAHYGFTCAICDFNFATAYGNIGEDFIHVHHLKDLAGIGGEYEVDAIKDLRPVCPNCHAMLHVEKPAMSIDKLRAIVATHRR